MISSIQVYDRQAQFLNATEPVYMFCGGVGSGKTVAGAVWALQQIAQYPKARGFIGANTYLQLHKSTLVKLFSLLQQIGLRFVWNKAPPVKWGVDSPFQDHKNIISCRNGAQILCYSLDNFDVIRGIETGWAWIDETRDTNPEAFDVLLERLRGFDDVYPGMPYRLRVTTTPDGFSWLHDKFVNERTKLTEIDRIPSRTRLT